MWNYNYTNELCHVGILGMKWGKRSGSSITSSSSKPKTSIKEKISSSIPKKKDPLSKMSDNDLRQKINRIQMENQYKQLTKQNSFDGKKFVTGVISNAAQQTASKYVSQYMNKGVEAVINKVINK